MTDQIIEEVGAQLEYTSLIHPFNLTEMQAKLLLLLLNSEICPADSIQKKVGMQMEPKVAVHRLRQKLKGHKISIQAQRFRGFWLEQGDKDRVRHILQEKGA